MISALQNHFNWNQKLLFRPTIFSSRNVGAWLVTVSIQWVCTSPHHSQQTEIMFLTAKLHTTNTHINTLFLTVANINDICYIVSWRWCTIHHHSSLSLLCNDSWVMWRINIKLSRHVPFNPLHTFPISISLYWPSLAHYTLGSALFPIPIVCEVVSLYLVCNEQVISDILPAESKPSSGIIYTLTEWLYLRHMTLKHVNRTNGNLL